MIEIWMNFWCGKSLGLCSTSSLPPLREREATQFVLASITIQIIVCLSIYSPPPTPWKNSPREERGGGPTYSWEYNDWFLVCSPLRVRKVAIFPFPLCEFPYLKDPNTFTLSPSQLGCFHGKWSRVSIFLLWGSGVSQQNENVSLLSTNLQN